MKAVNTQNYEIVFMKIFSDLSKQLKLLLEQLRQVSEHNSDLIYSYTNTVFSLAKLMLSTLQYTEIELIEAEFDAFFS